MALEERKSIEVNNKKEFEIRIMDYKKKIKELIRQLKKMGIRVVKTRRSHYKVYCPLGIVVCSSTTRNRHTYQRTLAHLRRSGAEV